MADKLENKQQENKQQENKTPEVDFVAAEAVIEWEDADGFCKFCGWNSCYPECHVEHSMRGWGFGQQTGCKYIESMYNIEIIDGELEWTAKAATKSTKK